jgi:hypothetical protein
VVAHDRTLKYHYMFEGSGNDKLWAADAMS